MADDPEKGASDKEGQPQKGDAPKTIDIVDRGKTLTMTLDKVKTLAQQGLGQERKARELDAQRQALQSDTAEYEDYKKLRAHLNANPETARAIDIALKNPASVLQPQQRGDDLGDLDGIADPDPAPRSTVELDELKRQVADLKQANQARDQDDLVTRQRSRIADEVGEYPWLKGSKVTTMAQQQIAQAMAADPHADLASVTAVVAGDFKAMLEESQTAKAQNSKLRQPLRTEPTNRGTPLVKVDKPITKEDLNNGRVSRLVKEAAKAWGLPVD